MQRGSAIDEQPTMRGQRRTQTGQRLFASSRVTPVERTDANGKGHVERRLVVVEDEVFDRHMPKPQSSAVEPVARCSYRLSDHPLRAIDGEHEPVGHAVGDGPRRNSGPTPDLQDPRPRRQWKRVDDGIKTR